MELRGHILKVTPPPWTHIAQVKFFKAPQTLISDEKLGSFCLSASENPTRVPFADSLPNLLVNSAMACSR